MGGRRSARRGREKGAEGCPAANWRACGTDNVLEFSNFQPNHRRRRLFVYTQSIAWEHRMVRKAIFNPFLTRATMLVFAASAGLAACSSSVDSSVEAEAPVATAQPEPAVPESAAPAEQRTVVSDRIPYGEVDSELVYGYFVFPSEMVEPLPAVILVHEWWGLTDTVRAEADRLAAQGYIVLAVDLFAGETTSEIATAREYMTRAVDESEATGENIRQAIDFIRATAGAPTLGVWGWGLGGGWALNAAMLFPGDIDATIIFYGDVSDDVDQLAQIDAPILGFFGENDRGVMVRDVREFESELELLGKDREITIYPGAGHGFANPQGRNYNPALADRTWERSLGFLAEKLYSDDS